MVSNTDYRSSTNSTKKGEQLIGNILVLLLIAIWWVASLSLPDFILPSPVAIFKATFNLFTDPAQLSHVGISVVRVFTAVILSMVIGTALAVLAFSFPIFQVIVHERIRPVLSSFPSIGWAILAVIWFKVSNFTVVFIEVMILIPFCLINVEEGLNQLDTELTEMGKSFSRSPVRRFLYITLPLILPYLLAALRMSYGVAWKLCLVAELFGTNSGLGFVMLRAETVGDAATVFASCFAIVLLFIVGERLFLNPLSNLIRT